MKRLDFLWGFLAGRGVSVTKSPTTIGLSSPASAHWSRRDDISFGNLTKLIEAQGCRLKVSLLRDGDEETGAPAGGPKPKALDFIERARKRYAINKADWGRRTGVSATSIRAWMARDDILWSQVCLMASIYGLSIRITISEKKQPDEPGTVSLLCTTHFPLPYECAGIGNKHLSGDNLSRMWEKKGNRAAATETETDTEPDAGNAVRNERESVARRLLAMGVLTDGQVAEASGLTEDEVGKLKRG